MKTEFLAGLGMKDEDIKAVMAENGKDIEREKAKIAPLEEKITAYETKLSAFEGVDVENLKGEIAKLQGEIGAINEAQAKEKSEQETNGIINSFYETLGKREFVNDYTRDSITAQIKNGMQDPLNKGKGVAEIFETLTKAKEGIFKNPNSVLDIPPTGDFGGGITITAEQFKKMGYLERTKLKTENPKLYEELKGE